MWKTTQPFEAVLEGSRMKLPKPKLVKGMVMFGAALLWFSMTTPTWALEKPNIVVIMVDDIGMWNIGAYHRGLMAGHTPNIDQPAAEGVIFADYYAEESDPGVRCCRNGQKRRGSPARRRGYHESLHHRGECRSLAPPAPRSAAKILASRPPAGSAPVQTRAAQTGLN